MSIPTLSYGLRGKLYLSSTGWIMLSVPNALGRGCYDSLREPGKELPGEREGGYNAHISVMRPEELARIGGSDKIDERGHEFSFTLGPVREVTPVSWDGVSKVWYVEVHSPELEALRKSYGLTPLPNENRYKFHITFAIRRRGVLHDNGVSKLAVALAESECRQLIRSIPGHQLITSYYTPENDTIWADYPNENLDLTAVDELKKLGVERTDAISPITNHLITVAALEVGPSAVHGYGLYARRRFDAGEIVVPTAMRKVGQVLGHTRYEQDPTSRYCNHSTEPNIGAIQNGDTVSLIAISDILPGEEILATYSKIAEALELPVVYTYRGRVFGKTADLDMGPRIDMALQGDMSQPSVYTQALGQVPLNFNSQMGVVGSLGDYLQRAKARGDQTMREGHSVERFQAAMDPNYANLRFRQLLAGQRPQMFSNPIDRFISGS